MWPSDWRFGCWLASGSCPTARADLTWAQKTVELHASPDDTVLEARYRFSNDGPAPVDIRDVQSSCGCTTVALSQRHFDPGQGGEIVARFTVGERVGIQKKTILVSTVGQPVATSLTLVVHIPEALSLGSCFPDLAVRRSPRRERPSRSTSRRTAHRREEMTVLSSNPSVKTEWQPVSDGRKYEIRVTPDRDGPGFDRGADDPLPRGDGIQDAPRLCHRATARCRLRSARRPSSTVRPRRPRRRLETTPAQFTVCRWSVFRLHLCSGQEGTFLAVRPLLFHDSAHQALFARSGRGFGQNLRGVPTPADRPSRRRFQETLRGHAPAFADAFRHGAAGVFVHVVGLGRDGGSRFATSCKSACSAACAARSPTNGST